RRLPERKGLFAVLAACSLRHRTEKAQRKKESYGRHAPPLPVSYGCHNEFVVKVNTGMSARCRPPKVITKDTIVVARAALLCRRVAVTGRSSAACGSACRRML